MIVTLGSTNLNVLALRHGSGLVLHRPRDNNTLHTEPRAARLLETMMFAAAR